MFSALISFCTKPFIFLLFMYSDSAHFCWQIYSVGDDRLVVVMNYFVRVGNVTAMVIV